MQKEKRDTIGYQPLLVHIYVPAYARLYLQDKQESVVTFLYPEIKSSAQK